MPIIAALRPLGAPLVFACLPDCFQVWSQGAARPVFRERLRNGNYRSSSTSTETNWRQRRSIGPRFGADWTAAINSILWMLVSCRLLRKRPAEKLTELIERTISGAKESTSMGRGLRRGRSVAFESRFLAVGGKDTARQRRARLRATRSCQCEMGLRAACKTLQQPMSSAGAYPRRNEAACTDGSRRKDPRFRALRLREYGITRVCLRKRLD